MGLRIVIVITIAIGFGNKCLSQISISFGHNSFVINEHVLEDSVHRYRELFASDFTICLHKKFERKIDERQIENVNYFWQKEGLLFIQAPSYAVVGARIYFTEGKWDDRIKMATFSGITYIGGINVTKQTTVEEMLDVIKLDSGLRKYNERFNERYAKHPDYLGRNGIPPEFSIGLDFGDGWHQAELLFDEKSHKLLSIDLFF